MHTNNIYDNQSVSPLPTWEQVEEQIGKEVIWLRRSVEQFLKKDRHLEQNCCHECFLRKIAIYIVTGEIRATEINLHTPDESFWLEDNDREVPLVGNNLEISHGAAWHSKTMQKIEKHFIALGFTVVREPALSWGRADLGVYKNGERSFIYRGWHNYFFEAFQKFQYDEKFCISYCA